MPGKNCWQPNFGVLVKQGQIEIDSVGFMHKWYVSGGNIFHGKILVVYVQVWSSFLTNFLVLLFIQLPVGFCLTTRAKTKMSKYHKKTFLKNFFTGKEIIIFYIVKWWKIKPNYKKM